MAERADSKKPQISVIVPVHNGQAYLEDCIGSIEGQTGQALEVIVVNDGSTDDTASVCEGLAARYDNLRVVTLPDLGVSAARNRGLEQAQGEYITFVDADDRLRPGMLAELYRILTETDSDLAGCAFTVWSLQEEWRALAENFEERECPGRETIIYNNESYLKESILRGNTRCWSKLYRRSLIGQTRFREGLSIGEDMLFLVELLPRISKAAETAYPGYGYFQNPNGAMKRSFTSAYMDQIYCWEMAKELILREDSSLAPQVNAQLVVALLLVVGKIACLSGKRQREAAEYLRVCHRKLRAIEEKRACYAFLPPGYGIKARLFDACPRLYVQLYHIQKSGRTRKRFGK